MSRFSRFRNPSVVGSEMSFSFFSRHCLELNDIRRAKLYFAREFHLLHYFIAGSVLQIAARTIIIVVILLLQIFQNLASVPATQLSAAGRRLLFFLPNGPPWLFVSENRAKRARFGAWICSYRSWVRCLMYKVSTYLSGKGHSMTRHKAKPIVTVNIINKTASTMHKWTSENMYSVLWHHLFGAYNENSYSGHNMCKIQ